MSMAAWPSYTSHAMTQCRNVDYVASGKDYLDSQPGYLTSMMVCARASIAAYGDEGRRYRGLPSWLQGNAIMVACRCNRWVTDHSGHQRDRSVQRAAMLVGVGGCLPNCVDITQQQKRPP
jgi:hypothetical protein